MQIDGFRLYEYVCFNTVPFPRSDSKIRTYVTSSASVRVLLTPASGISLHCISYTTSMLSALPSITLYPAAVLLEKYTVIGVS